MDKETSRKAAVHVTSMAIVAARNGAGLCIEPDRTSSMLYPRSSFDIGIEPNSRKVSVSISRH